MKIHKVEVVFQHCVFMFTSDGLVHAQDCIHDKGCGEWFWDEEGQFIDYNFEWWGDRYSNRATPGWNGTLNQLYATWVAKKVVA